MAAGVWFRGTAFILPAGTMLFFSFLLYRFRMMGAGDGKLIAVIAVYLGMDAGTEAVFTGMAVGAFYSLCRSWRDKTLKTRLNYLAAYFLRQLQTKRIEKYCDLAAEKGNHTLPLAAFMALGTYLYLMIAGLAAIR